MGENQIFIKAVAQVAPTYAMGIFRILKGTAMDISKVIANFWWGGMEENRKTHQASWQKLGTTKSKGEMLGIQGSRKQWNT